MPHRRARGGLYLRLLLAGLLGVCAALLVACGSTGKGLIPSANAGPLQSDFEAVAQAAESGEGSCTATEAAIEKTESDFAALPATVDAGLRKTLDVGIANLKRRALALCTQPLSQTTSTSTSTSTTKTSNTPTTTTSTQTTPPPTTTHTETTTTPTTPAVTTPTAPTPGGGTPAPGSESEPGVSNGPGGGTGIGGESGAGADGAQENVK